MGMSAANSTYTCLWSKVHKKEEVWRRNGGKVENAGSVAKPLGRPVLSIRTGTRRSSGGYSVESRRVYFTAFKYRMEKKRKIIIDI